MNSTKEKLINFVVIGDSAAFGTGAIESEGTLKGWAWQVANSFHNPCQYLNFSKPGSKSVDVLREQLPKAISLNPDICAVVVGGNDLLRNNFSPEFLYKNLSESCLKLREVGSEILILELHDPTRLIKLPRLLRRVLSRRVEAVNSVYRQISLDFGAKLIETRSIPEVHNLNNWHIDRMHPGPKGHAILAREVCRLVAGLGYSTFEPFLPNLPQVSKGRKYFWLLRNGAPWFLKRSLDLLPAALFLMAKEVFNILRKVDLETKYSSL